MAVESTPMKTVETSTSSSSSSWNDVITENQLQTVAASTPSTKSPAQTEVIQMPNLDSFAAKLNNFAVVLSEKAKSRTVTVGNVGEIEAALDTKKVECLMLYYLTLDLSSSRTEMGALGHTLTPFCSVCRQFFGFIPGDVHVLQISSDDVHPIFPWPSWLSLVVPQFPLCSLTRYSKYVSQPPQSSFCNDEF